MEWIRTFVQAARERSLSKASQRLNMTQPAASQQIRKLEEDLGVKLFQRTAAGLALTEAGQLLLERIVPVLSQLERIRKELEVYRQTKKWVIGTLPSFATHLMPEKVYHMKSMSIEADVIVHDSSERLAELLKSGIADAVLIDGRHADGFRWREDIFHEAYYVILPNDHPLARRPHLTIDEIEPFPFVVRPPYCDVRKDIEAMFRQCGSSLRIVKETANYEFMLGLVAAGTGITIAPQIIAEKHIRHIELTAVPLRGVSNKRTMTLVSSSKYIQKSLASLLAGGG